MDVVLREIVLYADNLTSAVGFDSQLLMKEADIPESIDSGENW